MMRLDLLWPPLGKLANDGFESVGHIGGVLEVPDVSYVAG